MMPSLPAKQPDQLVKVAGLPASNQPGEVFNAAQATTRLLREARLTWADLITGSIPTAAPPRKASRLPRFTSGDWWNDITICRARPDLLTDWERRFLENLTSFASLFPKQRATLFRLRERMRMAGAAP